MKKLSCSIIICLIMSIGYGQEINADEPGFEGEIVYTDIDGNTKDLEYQTASVKTKASVAAMLTGIGKVKSRVSVRGTESTTRLEQKQAYYFIYNHGDNGKNPKNLAQLVKFDKKGKNRVAEIASISVTTGAQSSGDITSIPFKGKKYNDSNVSYLLSVKNLEPGHYGWFLGDTENNNAHLFSIEGY